MEELIQKIDDLTEDLDFLKEKDDFDSSRIEDIIYELNNLKESIEENMEE